MTNELSNVSRGWQGGLARLMLGPRVRPLWIVAVIGAAMIAVYRGVLLYVLYTLPRAVPMKPLTHMVMLKGAAEWLMLGVGVGVMAMVLRLGPARAAERRVFRLAMCLLGSLTLTMTVCMEAADAAVFINTGSRINWRLGEVVKNYTDIVRSVSDTYPLYSMVILVVVLFYTGVRVFNYLFWLERRAGK